MDTTILVTLDNYLQAKILQDALSNEGIESFTKNEILSPMFGNISGFQIEVIVFKKDYEKAMEIFREGFPDLV